jgi:oxygen-independent coproporphyrinogen III oxidase
MFLYIHLPFCLSHCIYCDFYVELKATTDRRKAYLESLKQEITLSLQDRDNSPIETLYLGGGTPALFTAEEMGEILTHLKVYTAFSSTAEITLEANPEGMASSPRAYRELGVNRLSIGVQSLQPNELKRLSRIHSRDQVYRFLEEVRHGGFSNISIDLMYGVPEQTMASWEDTLAQVENLEITHISMYGLKVEEGTGLSKLIDQGRMQLPIDEQTVDMYFHAVSTLEDQGYRLYEISNLAKPGMASRHNLNYWDNGEFWGLGVSAHGYIDAHRYENPRDLKAYLENPGQRAEDHFCTEAEQLENAFIFGLRKREGVAVPELEAQYRFDFNQRYGKALARFFEDDFLTLDTAGTLALAPKAIPVSNEILAAFIGEDS